MPSLPRSETSAWVEVGGSRAEEYSVTHGETQAASCYIEAVQNQEFVIKAVSQTSGVMWTLIVDGEEQNRLYWGPGKVGTFRGRPIGASELRPFLFTKIALTDDDEIACQEEKIVKHLGSIQLELRRVLKIAGSTTRGWNSTYGDPSSRTFHEANKKAALSSTGGFGALRSRNPGTTSTFTYIDAKTGPPWCTYTFYYRDKDFLELHGHKEPTVRPAEPSAAPQAGPSRIRAANEAIGPDDNAARAAERREMQELRKENERLRKRVKLEVKEESQVKKESSTAVGLSKSKESGVIDLTLSDDD